MFAWMRRDGATLTVTGLLIGTVPCLDQKDRFQCLWLCRDDFSNHLPYTVYEDSCHAIGWSLKLQYHQEVDDLPVFGDL